MLQAVVHLQPILIMFEKGNFFAVERTLYIICTKALKEGAHYKTDNIHATIVQKALPFRHMNILLK